jgi:hypothetical protein
MIRLSRQIADQITSLSHAPAARLMAPMIAIAIEAQPAIAVAEKLATCLQANGLPAIASGDMNIYDGSLQLLVLSTAAPRRIEECLVLAGLPHRQLDIDAHTAPGRITAIYEAELDRQRVRVATSHDAAAEAQAAHAAPPVGLYHEPEASTC